MTSTPIVCVPDDRSAAALAHMSDVRFVVWEGGSAAPAGIDQVEFAVGSYSGRRFDVADFAQMPRLRVLQVMSAGFDLWLKVIPPSVTLCNGRGVHGGSTAETGVLLALAHVRDLSRYALQQRAQVWQPKPTRSISDLRVLILGAGDIAVRIVTALRAMDATVTVAARTQREGVIAMADVLQYLPDQDVVISVLPLTEETTGLINKDFLAAMKDGAVLVNVGRGQTIATDALVAELESGRLLAGLDVTDPEPLPAGHPLWSAPGLILTPHVGGGTPGWFNRAITLVQSQLERFLTGQPLINIERPGQ